MEEVEDTDSSEGALFSSKASFSSAACSLAASEIMAEDSASKELGDTETEGAITPSWRVLSTWASEFSGFNVDGSISFNSAVLGICPVQSN